MTSPNLNQAGLSVNDYFVVFILNKFASDSYYKNKNKKISLLWKSKAHAKGHVSIYRFAAWLKPITDHSLNHRPIKNSPVFLQGRGPGVRGYHWSSASLTLCNALTPVNQHATINSRSHLGGTLIVLNDLAEHDRLNACTRIHSKGDEELISKIRRRKKMNIWRSGGRQLTSC